MNAQIKNQKGFQLVEMIIYIALLVVITMAVVNTTTLILRSYQSVTASRNIQIGGMTALDRMTREIRNATSVDSAQSTLTTSPGQLTINSTDDAGTAETLQFFVSNSLLRVKENGVDSGPLLPSSVTVTNLIFRLIDSGQSNAVKIEMTLQSGSGSALKSSNFYATVVLRGSYK